MVMVMKERIIMHIDVNNAFLSWTATEMVKNGYKKDIRNRYAVIGGDASKRKGIVLAKSNPCKSKGVITGETLYNARRKCPYLEVYAPDYKIYRKYSDAMFNYLSTYTNVIERYSIDECFVDFSDLTTLFGDPIKCAYKIKEDIKNKLGFTVNVGIGNNKLCAKMASDFSKPDKVHTLFNNEIKTKMWPLDVSDLFMIGKKSSLKLKELHINTIYDLAHTDKKLLERIFKKMGTMMWEYANGIDNSEVDYIYENPKSISSSSVLPYNYTDINEILKVIKELTIDTGHRLRKSKMYANTVTVWVKYSNFEKVSKQQKLENSISSDEDIYKIATLLFNSIWTEESIRGLCVGVADLSTTKRVQLSIFSKNNDENEDKLQEAIDSIREKYGSNLITYANIKDKNINRDNNLRKH